MNTSEHINYLKSMLESIDDIDECNDQYTDELTETSDSIDEFDESIDVLDQMRLAGIRQDKSGKRLTPKQIHDIENALAEQFPGDFEYCDIVEVSKGKYSLTLHITDPSVNVTSVQKIDNVCKYISNIWEMLDFLKYQKNVNIDFNAVRLENDI